MIISFIMGALAFMTMGPPAAHAADTAVDTETSAAFDTGPAEESLQRLLPKAASQFTLAAQARQEPGVDSFSVSGTAGAIRVQATSPATLLAGVGWYLRHVAHVDIGLPGDSIDKLPATLPAVQAPFTNEAVVPHRHALNDTDDGYSGAYRSFADYQREIDVLALHGYNEVLVTVGAEKAYYYQALQKFGYSPAELRNWIPAPSHQAWWLLQNMSEFGGPVSEQLINARAARGKQVIDQLRELGMTPVLPGYYGTVPDDFASRNPGAHTVSQGDWEGFRRPAWLDPATPQFASVASAYYAAQRAAFGDSTLYKMDPMHEGGTASDIDVTSAARGIQRALLDAHPDATWVILGWWDRPKPELLAGVDKSKMLILAGRGDWQTGAGPDWGSTPYAYGTIPNFGGKSTLGGNTAAWISSFHEKLTIPGSTLKGIAYMPEATGNNPAALALFGDLAWTSESIDGKDWFRDYATARYGGADPHATAAWELLRQGPYSTPADGSTSEPQSSLFTARPSLTAVYTGPGGPAAMRYDPSTVLKALKELLKVDPALRSSDAYRYDLIDVARQALANHSRVLLPQIRTAYTEKDLSTFRSLVSEWNADMATLDKLTATDARFMVGTWLAQVPGWAADSTEGNQLQYDARSILTTWGGRTTSENAELHDYAGREWSGLISDVYAKRWAAYFASLDKALETGKPPQDIDFFPMDNNWAHQTNTYPTQPTGDPFSIASSIADSLPTYAPITGSGSDRCVDIRSGSSADSTPLQLYGCNGTPAQTWTFPDDGTIRALGKCMDVRGNATSNGTTVQLYHCNDTPAQRWTYEPATQQIKVSGTNKCLDAQSAGTSDGTPLIIWECHGGTNQQWSRS